MYVHVYIYIYIYRPLHFADHRLMSRPVKEQKQSTKCLAGGLTEVKVNQGLCVDGRTTEAIWDGVKARIPFDIAGHLRQHYGQISMWLVVI